MSAVEWYESIMLIPRLLFIVAMQAQLLFTALSRSLSNGIEDPEEKYPYVVSLVKENRQCTGTLITPNWVLTAAHCFSSSSHVQYGDSKRASRETRKILNTITPPASYLMIPDIGLLYIDNVPMNNYGKLSAVDYKTLEGLSVKYASYISTNNNQGDQPLQVGEGLAIACEQKEYIVTPFICMVPKCSNISKQQQNPGEAGEPLFFDGKVVAVHTGSYSNRSIRQYTPISPYLSWIRNAMSGPPQISFKSNAALDRLGDRVLYQRFHNVSRYLYGLKFRLKAYRERVVSALFKQLAKL